VSPLSVADTVTRLTGIISARQMRLFAVIDQRAEARRAGLDMPETVLVIFGSPAAGTPVMGAAPMSAMDLPLKVLVRDEGGQTKVSYYDPAGIAAEHHVPPALAGNLAGINALTDAATDPAGPGPVRLPGPAGRQDAAAAKSRCERVQACAPSWTASQGEPSGGV
jgi:uncharacterized protein (DUF302 family)